MPTPAPSEGIAETPPSVEVELGNTVMVVTGIDVEGVDIEAKLLAIVVGAVVADSVEGIAEVVVVGATRVGAGERMSAGTLKLLRSQSDSTSNSAHS